MKRLQTVNEIAALGGTAGNVITNEKVIMEITGANHVVKPHYGTKEVEVLDENDDPVLDEQGQPTYETVQDNYTKHTIEVSYLYRVASTGDVIPVLSRVFRDLNSKEAINAFYVQIEPLIPTGLPKTDSFETEILIGARAEFVNRFPEIGNLMTGIEEVD